MALDSVESISGTVHVGFRVVPGIEAVLDHFLAVVADRFDVDAIRRILRF